MRSIVLALVLAAPALAQPAPAPAEPTLWGLAPALPTGADAADASLKDYRVPEERFAIHLTPEKTSRRYRSYAARFPSPVKSRWAEIHGTYFQPVNLEPGQRVPAAVVVHHLGGSFEAEMFLAQHLAQNGVAAFYISLPNYGKRREPNSREGFLSEKDPLGAFAGFRQAALDVIRATDFLRSLPEVDPTRVGAAGVSLGAVVTALAKGVDARLGKTVLIIGGGDLPRLLTESPEAQELLAKLENLGPPEQLRAMLVPILKQVDPLTFAHRVRTDDVLMLNARRDEVIPEGCTLALWERMGRPRIRWFDCGHYGAVLHILTIMTTIQQHMTEGDAPK